MADANGSAETSRTGIESLRAKFAPDLAAAAARDFEAGSYLQDFLVATVATILLTRVFLGLTGFPRMGGGGLHIAHMLWGGLLMLVALILLLAVLGKRTKRVAAVIGGAGFGLFVDELGKFVTADNNYFFQPTIAIIYALLLLLFLGFRAMERRSLSEDELLANAADMVREVVMGGATEAEISRTLALLERCHAAGPVADGLRAAVSGAVRAREDHPPRVARVAARAWRLYDDLIGWHWFQRAVLLLFLGQAALGFVVLLALVGVIVLLPFALLVPGVMPDPRSIDLPGVDAPSEVVGALGSTASGVVSLVFVMLGALELRRSRLSAYRWLERSVLVSVLFGQLFLFWEQQLGAVLQLAWSLLLLAGLRYAIRQEEARRALRIVQESTNADQATGLARQAADSLSLASSGATTPRRR
jgi:hypothetical protein